MTIDLNDVPPQDIIDDIAVADNFTVDICPHGYGALAFWKDGARLPFAVAYFEPESIPDIAAAFVKAMRTEGNA